MRLNRKIFPVVATILFVTDFFYLTARNAVSDVLIAGRDPLHTILVILGLSSFAVYSFRRSEHLEKNPAQLVGKAVISATAVLLLLGFIQFSSLGSFRVDHGIVVPVNVSSVLVSTLLGIGGGVLSIIIFQAITELIFIKRRKNTRRNYGLLLVIAGAYILVSYVMFLQQHLLSLLPWLLPLLFFLSLGIMLVNAFRFSWILVFTRKEKLANLFLTLFGFVFFVILAVETTMPGSVQASGELFNHALLFYHPLVQRLVSSVCLFGAMYMALGFTSTLLHLPTAKEFDRKRVEISSLQNMSRLTTQVFDFDELVATTTHLALDVSESDASWLELTMLPERDQGQSRKYLPETAHPGVVAQSLRNISLEQIEQLKTENGRPLQELVADSGKPVIVQDYSSDRRVRRIQRKYRGLIGSVALVPLNSHDGITGILGVAKTKPYEFDKDVLNILYAFADMVSVAIENSRLIRESFARERFEQEISVAREMQQSLLPSLLPLARTYDIAARSIPAYEVGGDYYDVVQLDEHHLGFSVGDVSGKGVSAAFYMAQVKGIFQSLTAGNISARDILLKMNVTLCNNMERKSFISLLYAILDIRSGKLVFSRAGHCPLLYISSGQAQYLRPNGMGLGLDNTDRFNTSIEEEELQLQEGDTIVLYTDGVTEAKNPAGEEFHFSRLADVVTHHRTENAETIMNSILQDVTDYTDSVEMEDDMTVLVLRWKGEARESEDQTNERVLPGFEGEEV